MSKLDLKMTQTFEKREGTTNKGHDYEDLVLTRILFKLAHDNNVEDFTASSNDSGLGSLDDLVVDVKYKDKSEKKFYWQLKHRGEGKKKITRDMLAAETGDFSLQEIMSCFASINKGQNLYCGLYTTGSFDPDPKYEFTFKLKNKNYIKIEAIKCEPNSNQDFFSTSQKKYTHMFKIHDSVDRNSLSNDEMLDLSEYENFFKHFYLYSNQEPLEKINISTKMLFKEAYHCEEECFSMFREFISKWSQFEGKKNYLNKEIIKFKIAESPLKPYIRVPNFSRIDSMLSGLRTACLENDITLIEGDDHKKEEKVLNMYEIPSSIKSDDILSTGKEFYIISEETQHINHLEERQKSIILWHMKKLPLVIRTVDVKNISDIIQFCWEENKTNRKFILIGENINKNKFPVDCKIFRSLQDLNVTSDAYKKIAAKTISLQSRNPVSIETLINENEDVKKIITTNTIIEMLTSSSASNIAPIEEALPYPYMKQFLPRMTIHWTILGEINEDNIFVLSYYKHFEKNGQFQINGLKVISVEQFLQAEHNEKITMLKELILLVKDGDITTEEFRNIHKENTSKSWHYLKVQEDRNLEWISSHGNTDILQKYIIQTDYVEAKYLLNNTNNKVNIVCAKSGSGKSVLLKYLRLNWPCNYWTIYINFREFFLHFHDDDDSQDILESIFKFQSEKNNYNRFVGELRTTFVKDGRIVVFWDGLDELPISHHVVALNTILRLSTVKNMINWITARDHLKFLLEKTFKILSFSIKEMDRSQQEDYIKDYFRLKNEVNDKNEFKEIVDKIIKIVSVLRDVGFLGIPLQIAMLTELFYQNAKKYENWFENSITFTITDLSYHFLKGRIVFYFKERGQCDITNNFIKNSIKDRKKYQFSLYEVVALKTFLPSEVFASLKLKARDAFSVFGKRHDDFGIISQINDKDESVTFIHNVFGEFFVARWMVEHLEHVSSFKHFFFEDTFRTIRMLFDMMLAKNCPLHLAVLATDFSDVQKYEELIDQRDAGGRSPLHLVCSWGKMRPLLAVQEKNNLYEIDISNDNAIEDSDEYKKILNFLVKKKKVNTFEKDGLFQWTFIDYANESFSLLPLDVIIENHQFEERVLKKFDIASLLYYSIKFNYQNIFNNVNIVYVDSIQGLDLLHFSALSKNGSWFLERILKNKRYLKGINKPAVRKILLARVENAHPVPPPPLLLEKQKDGFYDVYRVSKKPPLILATLADNEEAVRVLLNKGADINVCDESHNNALFCAVIRQHINIIKLLTEKGIDKNQTNCFKDNVLHISTNIATRQYVHNDIVEYLLKKGVFICFNEQGLCPLSYATMSNRKDILDLLLTYGIFFGKKENHIRRSFILAVRGNMFEMVKYFIQNGVDTNTYLDPKMKTTALHAAAMYGNIDLANLLLKNKASIDACDCEGKTPLHFAVMIGSIDMVKLLVAKGATLTKFDCQGLAPIWYALKNDVTCQELVITCSVEGILMKNIKREIVERTVTDKEISKRVMNDGREIFKFLVENGADVNVVNKNGMSLLEHIEQSGDNDIIQFLISKGVTRKRAGKKIKNK